MVAVHVRVRVQGASQTPPSTQIVLTLKAAELLHLSAIAIILMGLPGTGLGEDGRQMTRLNPRVTSSLISTGGRTMYLRNLLDAVRGLQHDSVVLQVRLWSHLLDEARGLQRDIHLQPCLLPRLFHPYMPTMMRKTMMGKTMMRKMTTRKTMTRRSSRKSTPRSQRMISTTLKRTPCRHLLDNHFSIPLSLLPQAMV